MINGRSGVLLKLNRALTWKSIEPENNYVAKLIAAKTFTPFAPALFKQNVGSMIGAFVVPNVPTV